MLFLSEGPGPLKPLNWFYYCTTQETPTTQHHHLDIQYQGNYFTGCSFFWWALYLLSLLSQYSTHYPSDSDTWSIFQRCWMRAWAMKWLRNLWRQMHRIKNPLKNHDGCTLTIMPWRGTAYKPLQRSRAVHCLVWRDRWWQLASKKHYWSKQS